MTLLGFLRDLIAPAKEEGTSNAGHRYSRRWRDAKDPEGAPRQAPWQYEYDNAPKGRVRTGAMPIDNDQLRFAINRLLARAGQSGNMVSKSPAEGQRTLTFHTSGKVSSLVMKHPTRGEIEVELVSKDLPRNERRASGSFEPDANRIVLVVDQDREMDGRELERHLQKVFAHEWTHSLDKELRSGKQRQVEDRKHRGILRINPQFWLNPYNDLFAYYNRKEEVTAKIQEIVFSLTTKEAVAKLRKDAEYAATQDRPVHFRSGRGMVQQTLLASPVLQEVNRLPYTEANKKRIWRAVADTYNAIMDNKIKPLEGYRGPKRSR